MSSASHPRVAVPTHNTGARLRSPTNEREAIRELIDHVERLSGWVSVGVKYNAFKHCFAPHAARGAVELAGEAVERAARFAV